MFVLTTLYVSRWWPIKRPITSVIIFHKQYQLQFPGISGGFNSCKCCHGDESVEMDCCNHNCNWAKTSRDDSPSQLSEIYLQKWMLNYTSNGNQTAVFTKTSSLRHSHPKNERCCFNKHKSGRSWTKYLHTVIKAD